MEYVPSIILWVAIIGWLVYTFVIKKGNNRKAAQTGEDLARVKQAVSSMSNGASGYKLAYAHWEEQESYGRTVRTTYFRYAAVFQEQTLLLFPLGIDKKTGQIQAGQPAVLTPEVLGKVTVQTKEKEGSTSRVEVWLGDKEGRSIAQLYVDAENLRKNRWFPVNIAQQDQCDAFQHFITALSHRVAAENPDVDEKIAAESREGLGTLGAILSAAGAVAALFFPPFGAVVCLIGLIMSIVGKVKGAKKNLALIVSIVCAVCSAFFCWMYYTYLFF